MTLVHPNPNTFVNQFAIVTNDSIEAPGNAIFLQDFNEKVLLIEDVLDRKSVSCEFAMWERWMDSAWRFIWQELLVESSMESANPTSDLPDYTSIYESEKGFSRHVVLPKLQRDIVLSRIFTVNYSY